MVWQGLGIAGGCWLPNRPAGATAKPTLRTPGHLLSLAVQRPSWEDRCADRPPLGGVARTENLGQPMG